VHRVTRLHVAGLDDGVTKRNYEDLILEHVGTYDITTSHDTFHLHRSAYRLDGEAGFHGVSPFPQTDPTFFRTWSSEYYLTSFNIISHARRTASHKVYRLCKLRGSGNF
jgi:hypothetical protein